MADKSLNRTEFVAAVAAESGQSQAAVNGVVEAFFAVLATSLGEGTKVSIPGWMAVERTHRAARAGRNPQTGEAIEIKASNGVKLSAGSKLKAAAKG
jgi:DNA-binding protein HU-beta